jgi:hypothetical protein
MQLLPNFCPSTPLAAVLSVGLSLSLVSAGCGSSADHAAAYSPRSVRKAFDAEHLRLHPDQVGQVPGGLVTFVTPPPHFFVSKGILVFADRPQLHVFVLRSSAAVASLLKKPVWHANIYGSGTRVFRQGNVLVVYALDLNGRQAPGTNERHVKAIERALVRLR